MYLMYILTREYEERRLTKIRRNITVDPKVWREAQKNVKKERPPSLSFKIEGWLIKYNEAVKEQAKEKQDG